MKWYFEEHLFKICNGCKYTYICVYIYLMYIFYEKFSMSHQQAVTGQRRWFFFSSSLLLCSRGTPMNMEHSSDALNIRKNCCNEELLEQVQRWSQSWNEDWSTFPARSDWKIWGFLSWRREGYIATFQYLKGIHGGRKKGLCQDDWIRSWAVWSSGMSPCRWQEELGPVDL